MVEMTNLTIALHAIIYWQISWSLYYVHLMGAMSSEVTIVCCQKIPSIQSDRQNVPSAHQSDWMETCTHWDRHMEQCIYWGKLYGLFMENEGREMRGELGPLMQQKAIKSKMLIVSANTYNRNPVRNHALSENV